MELFLHFPYVKRGLAAKKEFTNSPTLAEKAGVSAFLDPLDLCRFAGGIG
jgi:hypothetical protein